MEYRLRPLGFMEFFAKQQSSGSLENEMNRKSIKYEEIQTRTVGISYEYLRVVVSVCECMRVCAYACMCYSYVWMSVFMRLSQATNAARCVSGCEFVSVS